MRPGPKDGQDTYGYINESAPSSADVNFDYVHELVAEKWTDHGALVTWRSFIKFDSLSLIPSNAKVTSATLYLYGLTSSLAAPQGNSVYPGSPYASAYPSNACLVQRVVGHNWKEGTLTWNNQPSVTEIN